MQVRVSVWRPPDESDSPTYRAEGHAVKQSDPPRWRIQMPRTAVSDWPDNVVGCELLMTDDDDDHYAGEIQRDRASRGRRFLRIPRDDGPRAWAGITQVGGLP
jgi:hypothetical protein